MNAMRATVIDLLNPAEGAHGGKRNPENGQVRNTNLARAQTQDADYTIRRLKRDAPDLAAPG